MGLQDILFGSGGGEADTPGVPEVPAGVSGPAAPPPQMMMAGLPAPEAQPQAQAPAPGFMDKLRSDPALTQSMLMMGARLMQGPKPGQDMVGAFGDAAMLGMTAHEMLKDNERVNAIQAQDQLRKNKLADAQIAQEGARTEGMLQDTAQKKEAFPETQKKLTAEIRRLTLEGDLNAAKILKEQFRNDPKRLAEEWELDKKVKQANINQSNAAAGASSATAALAGERTAAAKTLNTEGDPNAVLHGTRNAAASAKDQLAGLKITLKAAYPDLSDADIAKEALKLNSGKKGESLESVKALLDYGTPEQVKWARGRLAEMSGFSATPTPATPAGGKFIDEASIQSNMTKYGKTRQQVLDAAKAQGYTIKGK